MSSFRTRLEAVEKRLLFGSSQDELLGCMALAIGVNRKDPEAIAQVRAQIEAVAVKYAGRSRLPEVGLALLDSPIEGDE